jgi:hypothetical protein
LSNRAFTSCSSLILLQLEKTTLWAVARRAWSEGETARALADVSISTLQPGKFQRIHQASMAQSSSDIWMDQSIDNTASRNVVTSTASTSKKMAVSAVILGVECVKRFAVRDAIRLSRAFFSPFWALADQLLLQEAQ